jgi:hypothetical protein
MFKGPSGGYDLARSLYGVGGLTGIFSPIGFEITALYKGQSFEPLPFCTGVGIILASFAAVGYGIRQKDKGVADAQATMQTTENSQ